MGPLQKAVVSPRAEGKKETQEGGRKCGQEQKGTQREVGKEGQGTQGVKATGPARWH